MNNEIPPIPPGVFPSPPNERDDNNEAGPSNPKVWITVAFIVAIVAGLLIVLSFILPVGDFSNWIKIIDINLFWLCFWGALTYASREFSPIAGLFLFITIVPIAVFDLFMWILSQV